MQTVLNFKTVDEFEDFTENARDEICSCILLSLQEAFELEETEPVVLFEVDIDEDINTYDIYLHRNEWVTALSGCLDVFTEYNRGDDAIDTYLLIKKIEEVDKVD
jgi:hypothetical protein